MPYKLYCPIKEAESTHQVGRRLNASDERLAELPLSDLHTEMPSDADHDDGDADETQKVAAAASAAAMLSRI
jgi:hypothetical protein